MFTPPSIVNEVEFELVLDADLPIIEGEAVDDPETELLNKEADTYEFLTERLDKAFFQGMEPWMPAPAANSPRSESFRVWMAEREVFKAQLALEDALRALATARASFALATTPPAVKPVI
jgi:hypothetical protein